MQRSIFTKYFTVCATMVISSIVVLGLVFLVFISQYFKNDKYKLLNYNAERAATAVAEYYEENNNQIDGGTLSNFFEPMAQSIDTTFFLTDTHGKTVYCTEMPPCVHTTYSVGQTILDSISSKGNYSEVGKLGGVYKDNCYTVAVPVTLSNGSTLGYVFTSAHVTKQQNNFINEMLKMFLISSTGVLIITFIAVYFVSIQMVKPLRQMSIAAQKFGKGEFNTRLEVTSYDETGQLAMALNNMAQSLSVSENTRRSFIANISHELKTPMTSISGFIDGILDGTIPPEKEKHYLNIVSGETKRLSRLVRTMLNLSRIEAGEMRINTSKINIVDTICQTVFSFEQQIDKKNITIKGLDHDKVMVEADADLIHQVVYNLTENAVKFVDEGGYIEFSFSSDNQNTSIGIKNSGAGLSKEEIPKIFDRFYKTDKSRGLDKNGVGLGLYIVRSVVNLHGGDVIVRSVEGEYSEFAFSIPNPKSPSKFKKS
ncbi:MAG: HAMP domain-containing sensor histidine kinase [Oscillospiraceae bacterium]